MERLNAGLTQEELAERIGTKKSFISRVEKGRADIQLSTLVRLFHGLGRHISVRVFYALFLPQKIAISQKCHEKEKFFLTFCLFSVFCYTLRVNNFDFVN